jgi:sortase A
MLRILSVFALLVVSFASLSSVDARAYVRLQIDAIGVSSSIITFPLWHDTWAIDPWEDNIGHLEATSWLDAPGNIVLAGHSRLPNGNPGILANLNQVGVGTELTLSRGEEERRYVVNEVKIVSEYDIGVIMPTNDERITLITCDVGSYDPTTGLYTQRLVVVASRVG